MRPWGEVLAGRIDNLVIDSNLLRDNPLGDPHERPLWVYVPPGYEDEPDRRYPSVYMIQGLTGQVDMWRNRKAFRPTVLELIDALMVAGGAPATIVVFVDAWTSLGGSQFLDSPATGRYHSYLCNEVVPFVDQRYRTLAAPGNRGIMGHSSGGYGAMVTPMLRPDLFGGLATHAGDALFESVYLPDFRDCARALKGSYQGSFETFIDDFRSRPAFTRKSDATLLNIWCMAACYSADEDGTVRLPFDPDTSELLPDVWARWLARDPVRMAGDHAPAIDGLRAIYIDAGKRDEYFLDLGAEAFRRALAAIGVTDVFFELFDGAHSSIEYRYPISLGYLAKALSP